MKKCFKSPFYEAEMQLHKLYHFSKYDCHFDLKVPLFVEKRQNKFAQNK